MSSKIFTARNNLTVDGNFSPSIILVRSSSINTTITITVNDSVDVDKIFIVKCFTNATIITSTWTITVPSGSCAAFTRLSLISAQPVRGGESCAVVSMSDQSVIAEGIATITNIIDPTSEIGMPSASATSLQRKSFVYFSTTGGLLIAQTFISRTGLTGTNSALHLANYPNIPGIDGSPEASLIPPLSQNIATHYGLTYECSASSEQYSWTAAYQGFNFGGSWYTAGTTTGWFQVRLPFSVIADRFNILSAIESPPWETFTKWEILGSNDGVTFKRLFYSNIRVPRTSTRYYFTENIAPYRWYRFNGLEGTGINCGISELQFYAKSAPIQLLNTNPSLRNDGYSISKTVSLNMSPGIPVYFWFTPPTWQTGNFSGYCVIRK